MSTVRSLQEDPQQLSVGPVFHPARILIVDDEAIVRDVLARKLVSLGHACESCENGMEALELLASGKFDLVLADVLISEIQGTTLLKEALRISPDIAVILVTSVVDIGVAVDSLKDGAYDFITKPFSLEEVSISVSRALEKRRLLLENQNYQRTLVERVASRTGQLKEALGVLEHTYHSTLVALSKALDSRDADSDGHSLRVTVYATKLARQLGMSEAQTKTIERGVLLHDIGKIGIPDALLRKREKLNPSEWQLMQRHPEIGYRILSSIKFLKGAAQLVLHHHEQFDGNGYPQKLKGSEIDSGARVFAIADALDDLTSDRPFQSAISFEAAIRKIENMSGAQLDPAYVQEFLKIPVSSWKTTREEVAATTRRSDFLRRASGKQK
ncbi:MAG: response regulator [Acidobacteria bacterium]|nr:response regulator [Acidobacteriota bacterium]